MHKGNFVPSSGDGGQDWAMYGNLRIPPEIAALLGGPAPSRLDGHVSRDHQPSVNSNVRENGPFEDGDAPMSSEVVNDDGVASSTTGVPPAVTGASGASKQVLPRNSAAPRVVPRARRGAPVPRLCGHCKAPGHTRKHCPALGKAPLDPNRNAIAIDRQVDACTSYFFFFLDLLYHE